MTFYIHNILKIKLYPWLLEIKNAKSSKNISTLAGYRISKTTKTLKHFMILLVTPEAQQKS